MYRKKIIIVISSIIVIFILIPILIYLFIRDDNMYGGSIAVSNLSSFTKGQATNQERISYIEHNLFNVINLNVKKPIKSNSLSDVKVRSGSFIQTDNSVKNTHDVTFIIDIESLSQSYNVSYQWSDAKNVTNDEYGTQVTCLPIDKLRYGDFHCIDERIEERGVDNYNPIEKILPYVVQYKYSIKSYKTILETDKVNLKVEAFVPAWADKETTLDGYSKEIKEWIKSKKLDPDDYFLNYVY